MLSFRCFYYTTARNNYPGMCHKLYFAVIIDIMYGFQRRYRKKKKNTIYVRFSSRRHRFTVDETRVTL